ncbi:MAG: hypothetical protein GX295_00325 [Syntrophomonadaceae bacterium]|nr:hypothetical protein [Syntrophomonadaceae bacterium]
MNKILNKACTVFMAIAFLWAGLYMLCSQLLSIHQSEFMDYRIAAVSIILILGILYACKKVMDGKNEISLKMAVLILILLAVIPRYFLLHNVSVEQTSDYATYLVNSLSIYENFSVSQDWQLYFGAIAGNVPIICGIFALGFKLLGASLAVGLFMNVLFYTGAVVALYFLALRFTGKNTAFLTAAIYALWPNNICYSVSMSSEPMYIFFLFSGLALFTYGLQIRGIMLLASMLLSGAVLGLSQAIRPITVNFILSIVLVLVFYSNRKTAENSSHSFKQRLVILSTLIVAYMITLWGLGLYTSKIVPIVSKPSYGWSLFEGSNINTYGQWDPESSKVLSRVMSEYPLEQVQTVLLGKGIERIKSYDAPTLIHLLEMKTRNVFGNGDLFNKELRSYITAQPTLIKSGSVPMVILAWGQLSFWLYRMLALYFIYICFRCMYFILTMRERENVYRLFVMILPVCGIMAVHLLLTSIERYNYPAIPIMIMIGMTFMERYSFIFRKRMGG